MLNSMNADNCSELVLRLPTWRSDKGKLNEPVQSAFYDFIPTLGATFRIKAASLLSF